MSNDKDLGIYLHNEKIFYYLEAGNSYIGNTIERVRKTLIQRDLITPSIGNITELTYTVISIKEAKMKDYILKPIYLSKHIEKIYKTKNDVNSSFK